MPDCSGVQSLPYDQRCDYVQNASICENRKYFFNYVKLLYCGFKPDNDAQQFFSVMAMLSICLLMFAILGTTTDKFFCPTLKVVSLRLGMSEHLAGVTLLAFGNGSPDILTSVAAINVEHRFIFSDLIGSSLFVSVFVSGLICLVSPFRMKGHNLRDVCFLILSILCADYFVVTGGHVTILESLCMLLIYIAYMVVILADQYLLNQKYKRIQRMLNSGRRSLATVENQSKLTKIRSEALIDIRSNTKVAVNVSITRLRSFNIRAEKNNQLFQQFFSSLNPIDKKAWAKSGKIMRTVMVCRVPIDFVLLALIPLVDYERNRHGWSKLLNCVQIMTMPLILTRLFAEEIEFRGVPLFVYTLILTIPMALGIFMFTRTDIPPAHHPLFSLYSIVGSVIIIYYCCAEIVSLFDVLGMVTGRSTSLLGCTLLAWGNSIGDLIANVTLARQGYHRMGYAGCFGAPLFNLLVGLGVGFLYKSSSSENYVSEIKRGPLGLYSSTFSLISLFCILLWIGTTHFTARRSLGIFCIIFYCLYFIYVLLGDMYVLETYNLGSSVYVG